MSELRGTCHHTVPRTLLQVGSVWPVERARIVMRQSYRDAAFPLTDQDGRAKAGY